MARYRFNQLPEALISDEIPSDVRIIVCLPAYKEENLMSSLSQLSNCEKIDGHVEIIVLINEPEHEESDVKSIHKKNYEDIVNFIAMKDLERIRIYPIYVTEIPAKIAGVGLARKMSMNEAYRRFAKVNNTTGVIATFDGDAGCDPNYFKALDQFFSVKGNKDAASIYFEHPLENSSIILYELHLRYFINMQRLLAMPFAYYTMGSAMAVTANSYSKLGGMNTRKAGEDFYFLQKYILNAQCGEINSTRIIPSSRTSDRVPFGTGRAMLAIKKAGGKWLTYNPDSFELIAKFVNQISHYYTCKLPLDYSAISGNIHPTILRYLESQQFNKKLEEIKKNTSSFKSFEKRFYTWFNAFRFMKLLHYLRDNGFADVELRLASRILFQKLNLKSDHEDTINYLLVLRDLDKKQSMY